MMTFNVCLTGERMRRSQRALARRPNFERSCRFLAFVSLLLPCVRRSRDRPPLHPTSALARYLILLLACHAVVLQEEAAPLCRSCLYHYCRPSRSLLGSHPEAPRSTHASDHKWRRACAHSTEFSKKVPDRCPHHYPTVTRLLTSNSQKCCHNETSFCSRAVRLRDWQLSGCSRRDCPLD